MKNQPTRQNNRQLLKIMNMRKCKLEKKNMELHDIGIETIWKIKTGLGVVSKPPFYLDFGR